MTLPDRRELGIAVIGSGLMARAHSYAYRVADLVEDLAYRPRLRVICSRDRSRAERSAALYGFESGSTDLRRSVSRDDVDIVTICTPPGVHLEAIQAAADAGKAILCEKPLGVSYEDALLARDAAKTAGILNAIGFNYRRLPAVKLMKDLVGEGAVGEPRLLRALWLSDEFADPDLPYDWRFDRTLAGTAASDLGIHVIDLARWLIGEIEEVTAQGETFIRERLPERSSRGRSVTTDDTVSCLARFSAGALAVFEMTRVAWGRPLDWSVELNGSEGTLYFDYSNLNELWLARGRDDIRTGGFKRIRTEAPVHPYASRWWPPGQGVGYEASFVNQATDLVLSWPTGPWTPDFHDALLSHAVVKAIEDSAELHRWVTVPGQATASEKELAPA